MKSMWIQDVVLLFEVFTQYIGRRLLKRLRDYSRIEPTTIKSRYIFD